MKLKMNGHQNDLHYYSLLEELLVISLSSYKVYPHELD